MLRQKFDGSHYSFTVQVQYVQLDWHGFVVHLIFNCHLQLLQQMPEIIAIKFLVHIAHPHW